MAIIGIDLGTTNSLAAYWKDGKAELIPQGRMGEMLPSVVGFDEDGSIFVGDIAKERKITHSSDTFSSFKCFMGTEKIYDVMGKSYTPVDFSAMVLTQIKNNAEAYFGEAIEEAIISVPAYFNDQQRSDTKKAAKIAGLKVERLINEPSAAALAYRMKQPKKPQNLLVFDFGGGTLDLSLVECFDNIIEIVAIVGDNHLGGDNIDQAIAGYWCNENKLTYETLSDKAGSIIKKKAEQAKIMLSDEANEVNTKLILDGCEYEVSLDESKLYELCLPLFRKIKQLFLKILKDSDYHVSDIDDLIMVGGSSKVPVVKKFLQEMLGKEPIVMDRPDYSVAYGLGAYAGIRERKEDIKDMVMTDVCPFTLGIGSVQQKNSQMPYMCPMIERNSTLPISHREWFTTVSDFQREVRVSIYQGEEYELEKNVFLGSLTIEVPPKKAGEESIFVDFTYDVNGILQVDVTNSQGDTKQLVIANHEMSAEELQSRIARMSEIKVRPYMQEENILLLERAKSLYEQSVGEKREYIANMINWFSDCLFAGRKVTIAKAVEYMKNTLTYMEEESEHAEQIYFDGDLKLPNLDDTVE